MTFSVGTLGFNNSTFIGTLETATLTGNVTFTLPNKTGTVAFLDDTGVTGFTDATFTFAPNNVINAARLLVDVTTIAGDAVVEPKGQGSILGNLPDSTVTGGNKRGLESVDFQLSPRTAATQVASGQSSVLLGGERNTASGQRAFVVGGFNNEASQPNAFCIGTNNISDGVVSGAIGTDARVYGRNTVIVYSSGLLNASGDVQSSLSHFKRETTNATPTALTSDNNAPGTTNIIILQDDQVVTFIGTVQAKSTTGVIRTWDVKATVRRNTGVATTSVLNSVVNTVYQEAGSSTWVLSIVADTTNGGVYYEVTGQAATTIRWSGNVFSNELIV